MKTPESTFMSERLSMNIWRTIRGQRQKEWLGKKSEDTWSADNDLYGSMDIGGYATFGRS